MTTFRCTTCNTVAEENNLDLKNMILYCASCQSFQKVSPIDSINSIKESLKTKVTKPKHIDIKELGDTTTITIKQSRSIFLPLISITIFVGAFFLMTRPTGTEAALIFLSVILGFGFFTVISMQKRKIEIANGYLTSYTKRLYHRSFRTKLSLPIESVTQLFVTSRKIKRGDKETIIYDLMVKLDSENSQVFIEGHSKPKDLYFAEQFIESKLNIEDIIDNNETLNVSSLIPSLSGILRYLKNR